MDIDCNKISLTDFKDHIRDYDLEELEGIKAFIFDLIQQAQIDRAEIDIQIAEFKIREKNNEEIDKEDYGWRCRAKHASKVTGARLQKYQALLSAIKGASKVYNNDLNKEEFSFKEAVKIVLGEDAYNQVIEYLKAKRLENQK